ncbi:MAG: DedA family protein, partial [Candidatus Sungbacteria bacterium]|nr:DedA family protein [Candidatus Sungbacteria bacterium]
MDIIFAFILFPIDTPAALYAIFIGFLFISAFGLPIPEEIPLLLAGYLVYLGFLEFWMTVVVLAIGVMLADTVGYLFGRFAGDFLYIRVFGRFKFTRQILEKGKNAFDRYGEKVVLMSRPVAGLRFIVPILAGHFRMGFKKFVAYDAVAAVAWTFLLVTISYYLGTGLTLIADFRIIKYAIVASIGAVLVGWVLV